MALSAEGTSSATLEGESELLQFLKVVKPAWSKARRGGSSDITRVMEKLRSIGVRDKWELLSRVTKNKINEDLASAGHPCFSRDTLDAIRKQTAFCRALECLTEANYRNVGLFAPVPQLLSKVNLRSKAATMKSGTTVVEASAAMLAEDCEDASAGAQGANMDITTNLGRTSSDWSTSFPDAYDVDCWTNFDASVGRTLRLRGYSGEVKGTGRPVSASSSLPNLTLPSSPSSRLASTMGSVDFHAMGASGSFKGGDTVGSFASSFGGTGMLGSLLIERSRLRQSDERLGSPKTTTRSFSSSNLEAELMELHLFASQAVKPSAQVEEAIDRLARAGEEELVNLKQNKSFSAQKGTDSQVVRIAAHYAQMGILVKKIVGRLRNPSKTVEQVRHELDRATVSIMQEEGSAMAEKPRPSAWTGLGHSGGRHHRSSDEGPAVRCKTNLQHARAMLREHDALEEKRRLCPRIPVWRISRQMEGENAESPMKKHVVANIVHRLKEERDVEAEKLEVQQTCNNIRRHLTLMGNAKRDLNNLRRSIEARQAEEKSFGLKLSG